MSCMAFNCPLEHTAYVLDLLFQIIWSFRMITCRTVMVMILDSKAAKTCPCDCDVMIRIAGAKTIEAQCQECAVVFYEARVPSYEEDQK
jgi:hypothetical protein